MEFTIAATDGKMAISIKYHFTGSIASEKLCLSPHCVTALTVPSFFFHGHWDAFGCHCYHHGRMARGGHRLPKISPGPAMPNPPTPCGQAIPKTFQGWPARRGGLPTGWVPSDCLLPHWTSHAERLWSSRGNQNGWRILADICIPP
jgi:hypothetical protein